MDWFEIVRTGADIGFIVLCAGFVLWEVHDLYMERKKKDASESLKNDKLEDKKEKRYDEMLDNLQEKTDELYNILLEGQKETDKRYQELVDKILNGIKQPHILSEEENNKMTKMDEEIDLLLGRALQASNASRVHLVKYHNGGNDMLGNSILKMSMSNEICAAGIEHITNSFQNQLRSSFSYWVKELNETGVCYIKDIEDIKSVDDSIYQYMEQTGVKAKFGIAIRNNITNIVIGYICMDFLNKADVNLEQITHCLDDKRKKIETLLNL